MARRSPRELGISFVRPSSVGEKAQRRAPIGAQVGRATNLEHMGAVEWAEALGCLLRRSDLRARKGVADKGTEALGQLSFDEELEAVRLRRRGVREHLRCSRVEVIAPRTRDVAKVEVRVVKADRAE